MSVKKAKIRGKEVARCPFGLKVTAACKCAGNSVTRMVPVEGVDDMEPWKNMDVNESEEETIQHNKVVYYKHRDNSKCIYADTIMEKFDKVNCNFGDVGEGHKAVPFIGSPLYTSNFSGHGTSGIFSFPLGYYADNNESRNLFYGLFSLLGEDVGNTIVKIANSLNESNGNEFLGSLQEKIDLIKDNYDEGMEELHKYINEYSDKLEDCDE